MVISPVRGRLAPSPTGLLHLGHAQTFWIGWHRARSAAGRVVLRIEDLDVARCRKEFCDAIIQDLRWLGLDWDEGPDAGGPRGPYVQSERDYGAVLEKLRESGCIYPCGCSRRDILQALTAPHEGDEEPVYPGTCRPAPGAGMQPQAAAAAVSWRFRLPDGETILFHDERLGEQRAIAGRDFGDFVVWRKDHLPAYQLAVVADDAAMGITEVVRGEDLLLSTFRQVLLHQALGLELPRYYHCPLVRDETGRRLAKRSESLSLASLRDAGADPAELRARFAAAMKDGV